MQVKNRAPAPIQITAEQILREANDRVVKEDKAPRVHITDPEELMQVCRVREWVRGWGLGCVRDGMGGRAGRSIHRSIDRVGLHGTVCGRANTVATLTYHTHHQHPSHVDDNDGSTG